jgi:hypothetical protein
LLLLTVKGKHASFAVVLMIADSQLRMRDIEDLCDCFSPPPPLPILQSPKKKVWTESHWKKKKTLKRELGGGGTWVEAKVQ